MARTVQGAGEQESEGAMEQGSKCRHCECRRKTLCWKHARLPAGFSLREGYIPGIERTAAVIAVTRQRCIRMIAFPWQSPGWGEVCFAGRPSFGVENLSLEET
jgi:hypothetical protein